MAEKQVHSRRDTCRLCESPRVELRVPMVPTPIGGAFAPQEALDKTQEAYPLDLYQCADCGHIQLLDVTDPEVLFGNYTYFSGQTSLIKHFEDLAGNITRRHELEPGAFVVDVGSNDGAFLQFFKDSGMRVLGIDPAKNIAQYANEVGIPTLAEMFDVNTAENILKEHGVADVVTANNVFAHADDMIGMVQAVRKLLASDGLFIFEVSYFINVVDRLLLGAIFHEHLCYHTVKPLISFLDRAGLELIEVERVPIQGGSLICTAQVKGGKREVDASVVELVALEEGRNVYRPEFLHAFVERLDAVKTEVGKVIQDVKSQEKSIAGFGAARGGTLYVYHYGLGEYIDYIVDDDPNKQNTYSPGYHIPVLPTTALFDRKPDYVVVLAWVHSKAIVEKFKQYVLEGGRFITFFPEFKVIGPDDI
jgi:SAM-dependent methyltransferase